jgi:RND superfamily putative drug exporter
MHSLRSTPICNTESTKRELGTFGGMMAGEIAFLTQLGFAAAIGVLIDTSVVRTILDPALATLFGRWTWWPGGVPQTQTPGPETSVLAAELEERTTT